MSTQQNNSDHVAVPAETSTDTSLSAEFVTQRAAIWRAELIEKFEKLTPAKHRLMAFNCASTARSRPSTGEALLKIGLVRKTTYMVRGISVTDYEVPIPIHMAYCQWCEELESGIKRRSPQAK